MMNKMVGKSFSEGMAATMKVQPKDQAAPVDVNEESEVEEAESSLSRLNADDNKSKGQGDSSKSTVNAKVDNMVTYSWSNITVTAKNQGRSSGFFCCKKKNKEAAGPPFKTILNNVSGYVKSGQLLALMGSSGAGKTTLLNCLNFRSTGSMKVSGDRCLDRNLVGPEVISSISAYVQQDDMFMPRMKVREHLIFCSKVRMPSGLSSTAKRNRVDEVLRELGLWHIRNRYIGSPGTFKGISGGEKKRLAFASEILTDPSILFCDEPTSGLDSFMAQTVVGCMRAMAERGKAIICTIHQPSTEVFKMFDQLYLLAEGRVAFAGPRTAALDYFAGQGFKCPATYNPADFYCHTLAIVPDEAAECRLRAATISDNFMKTDLHKSLMKEALARGKNSTDAAKAKRTKCCGHGHRYKSSWCAQFLALCWRSFLLMLREPLVVFVRLLQSIFVGLLLCSVFWQRKLDLWGSTNITGLVALCCIIHMIFPCSTVITTFSLEIEIFLREHWNGMYRCSNYFLSKTLMELPIYFIFPFFFMPQVFYGVGLHGDFGTLLWHSTILGLVSIASCSIGYFCSTSTNSLSTAVCMMPILVTPFIIFCGAFITESGLWWTPLNNGKYLSWLFYGTEMMMTLQWENTTLDKSLQKAGPFAPFKDGHGILDYFGYTPDYFYENIVGILVSNVIFRIAAYICLFKKTVRKQI